jgi:hypothetical protein
VLSSSFLYADSVDKKIFEYNVSVHPNSVEIRLYFTSATSHEAAKKRPA